MSESTTPAQCRDEDRNLARDCGLTGAMPGTNAWDAALGRFAGTIRSARPAPAKPVGTLSERLIPAIEGECDGLAISAEQASTILAYLQHGALPCELPDTIAALKAAIAEHTDASPERAATIVNAAFRDVALRAAPPAPVSRAEPEADRLEELGRRIMYAIHDHGSKDPEDGETWESWHHAAFGLLGSAVGDLLDEAKVAARITQPAPNEREAFEQRCYYAEGAIEGCIALERDDDGDYTNLDIDDAWEVWQKACVWKQEQIALTQSAPLTNEGGSEPVAYVGWGGEGNPKTLLLKADLPVGTSLYAKPIAQQAEADEEEIGCTECHGVGRVEVTHEPLHDGYTETNRECCDTCQGTGKVAAPAPSASPVDLFAGNAAFNLGYAKGHEDARNASPAALTMIREKLVRFEACAGDDEGCDIGREWFDALTTIGLLSRTQRSPAMWSMTAAGDALLAASPAFQDAQPSEDKRDAERYRWLRERHWNESTLFVVAGHHSVVRLGTDCPSDERLDAAVDAAIAKGETL